MGRASPSYGHPMRVRVGSPWKWQTTEVTGEHLIAPPQLVPHVLGFIRGALRFGAGLEDLGWGVRRDRGVPRRGVYVH